MGKNYREGQLKMSSKRKEILLKPAIKAVMGEWSYYMSTMTYYEIKHYVKRPDEVYESKGLSDMIQRRLSTRYEGILRYLTTEPERFFNSLVLSVYAGEPKWHSYELDENGKRFRNVGLLEFTGDENIFPVDGQHRVEAIKKMVELGSYEDDEEVPVIFISHDPENVARTRRVFTTLNRYAKPVGASDKIALDEDDIVAIVTRYQVERFELMKDKIKCKSEENMVDDDNTYFLSIVTIYKCNEQLIKGFMHEKNIKESEDIYRRFRKTDEVIGEFYDYCCSFWTNLVKRNKDVAEYFYNNSTLNARSSKGGNLLFRPYAIKAYVNALVYLKIKHGVDYHVAIEKLAQYSFDLNSSTWNAGVLWNTSMVTGKASLIKNIFVYLYDKEFLSKRARDGVINAYASLRGIEEMQVDKLIYQK